MCGIAGILRFDRLAIDSAMLEGMADMLAHRGPDDRGAFVDDTVGLAHRRLSIIDLSPAGHQPMANAEETLWLVFNGEIYNYLELRSRLIGKGHRFRSQTDSEVILHAYAEWGDECVLQMRGMWAFAIWDQRRRRLFCSRDRMGIKPLYYTFDQRRLAFASEIKALATLEDFSPRADADVIYRFIVQHVADCDDRTTFCGIKQLQPGHNLSVNENGTIRLKKYWPLDGTAGLEASLSDDEYAAKFRELFAESVREHLQSDVPVGGCLSGGLDSSAIVALAADHLNYGMSTFSVAYPEAEHNEGPYIRAMHEAIPSLVTLQRTPSGTDLLETLERITWHFDEPVWRSTTYSWWHVMKLVHESGIKVVVNGQGADELLAGYPRYSMSYLRQLLRAGQLPTLLRELRLISRRDGESPYRLLRETLRPLVPSVARKAKNIAGFRTTGDDTIFCGDFRRTAKADAANDPATFWNLREHLKSDLFATRLPELLHAEDRFSMAFSIESRVPFLDHRLVEFAMGLPDRQRLRDGQTKFVLRKAMGGIVPSRVLERQDKKGYPTPVAKWLRGEIRDGVQDIFSSQSFRERGVFEPKEVQKRFQQFLSGGPGAEDVWRWLSVESWFRTFIDKKRPARRNELASVF